MAYAKAIQRQRQDLSIEPILPTIGAETISPDAFLHL